MEKAEIMVNIHGGTELSVQRGMGFFSAGYIVESKSKEARRKGIVVKKCEC